MQNKILRLGFLTTLGIMATATSVFAQSVTNQSDYSGHQTYTKVSTPIDSNNGNGTPNVTTYNPDTGTISGGGLNDPIQSGFSSGSSAGTGSNAGTGSASGSGGGLGTPNAGANSGIDSGNGSEGSTANGTPEGSDTGSGGSLALEKGECLTAACLKADGEPQKISLNDAAELLEITLDDSLDTLVAAEEAGSQADTIGTEPEGPRRIARENTRRNTLGEDARRIVRNSSSCVSGCTNPERSTVTAYEVNNRQISEAREVVERQLEASQKFIEQVNLIDPEKNIW